MIVGQYLTGTKNQLTLIGELFDQWREHLPHFIGVDTSLLRVI